MFLSGCTASSHCLRSAGGGQSRGRAALTQAQQCWTSSLAVFAAQPALRVRSPHQSSGRTACFIKVFRCIIDHCASPWEAADAGCSATAFHSLGLMINSHVQPIQGITQLRFLPTEMSVLAAKPGPQSLDNLYFPP